MNGVTVSWTIYMTILGCYNSLGGRHFEFPAPLPGVKDCWGFWGRGLKRKGWDYCEAERRQGLVPPPQGWVFGVNWHTVLVSNISLPAACQFHCFGFEQSAAVLRFLNSFFGFGRCLTNWIKSVSCWSREREHDVSHYACNCSFPAWPRVSPRPVFISPEQRPCQVFVMNWISVLLNAVISGVYISAVQNNHSLFINERRSTLG